MPIDPSRVWVTVTFALFFISSHVSAAAPRIDDLRAGFIAQPDSARPRLWWHWINGNVTLEGIEQDFAWMKRVGIGGVQNFDASFDWGALFDTPQVVKKPLNFFTPEWRETFRESVRLADRAHFEFAIASSPGWSQTGGPWVKPQQAMKKLVWSETWLLGGKPFKGRLYRPPQVTGPFQNIVFSTLGGLAHGYTPPTFYADVATIAFRVPKGDRTLGDLKPIITSSGGSVDAARLSDGDFAHTTSLPFTDDLTSWIQYRFLDPQQVRAVSIAIKRQPVIDATREPDPQAWLEAGDDGLTFRKVCDLSRAGKLDSAALQQTVSFASVSARFFRVVFQRPEVSELEKLGLGQAKTDFQIEELVLHTGARVNRFEDKAGFSTRQIHDEDDTPSVSAWDAIRKDNVINLTDKVRADGSLDWTPPVGRWLVVRFGYSLIGRTNHPASRAGTGLEVDKLSREHVKDYMDAYLGEYEKTVGKDLIGRRGIQYMMTDSYEAGFQNWTDDMLEQFRARRGYDALPWLPALTGRVVENAEASDRFLWDFRRTLADLIVDAHFGQIADSLRDRGMGGYGESHEFGRAFIGDGMDAKKFADVPMGAMWSAQSPLIPPESMDNDIRESASVAHIYGKPFVAAEALTAYGMLPGTAYAFSPEKLKPIADRLMAMGLNRFVIHTSVHQPDGRVGPGIGLGPFGQWFTRKETWADQAGGWTDYLSRSAYLLQQGQFVADIAYLYGEDTNITSLFGTRVPKIPAGYNFDFINPGALINEVSVSGKRLVTRSGMRYRVLVLDPCMRRVSVPLLRKLRDLSSAGAVIVGVKPEQTPSLADDQGEFRAIVDELWDSAKAIPLSQSLESVLNSERLVPDVSVSGDDSNIQFVHRSLGKGGDIYFLRNPTPREQSIQVSFRVAGRVPELWRADTGEMTPLSFDIQRDRTIISLQFEKDDAFFVVFREQSKAAGAVITPPTLERLTTIKGPWDVRFPPDRGAPAEARFNELRSWTENNDTGIKYFSGTASYVNTFKVQRGWLNSRARLQIDLGEVKNVAEVRLNGRSVGVLWKAPFRADITDAAKPGVNRIEIKVTNLWPNRLIGDKQPNAKQIAFASFDPYKVDSPLLPSGLLGPVTLLKVGKP
jgi:hypothetical protein